MGPLTAGAVVAVRFPFSDLTSVKLRPAVVLADAGRGDYVLLQVTSKPYADPRAVTLGPDAFASGALPVVSYARPAKLFTASDQLIAGVLGHLAQPAHHAVVSAVVSAVVALLRAGL
jgi:mRNA interferase MazF